MFWTFGPPALKWTGQEKKKKKKNHNNKKQNKTMTINRAQFPGKVQGIFHADSVMALNSHPVSDYHWVFLTTWRDSVWRTEKWKHHTKKHKTNSDSSAVCCDFAWMPTAPWQNWMTAQRRASGGQGSLKTQWFHFFFLVFFFFFVQIFTALVSVFNRSAVNIYNNKTGQKNLVALCEDWF